MQRLAMPVPVPVPIPSHPLAASTVFDTEGNALSLGSLFGERPLVVVFLRHFGCLFARQQTRALKLQYATLSAAGADVVAIGNGQVEDARAFAAEQHLPFRLLTDPTGESYCAVELQRGVASSLNPAVLGRGLRALWAGFRQTKIVGDPLQQGGALVIAPDGREVYRHASASAGDHPSTSALLRAVTACAHGPKQLDIAAIAKESA